MAEPAASAVGGIVIAAGTVVFSGTILGVHYDALLAGFFGGLLSLSVLPAMSRWKIACSVGGSSLMAGFFAPIFAAAALNYFPWLLAVGDLTRMSCAVVIGVCWQPLLPAGINKLRSFLGSNGGFQ